ncbi:MAG: tetratricopeptide repeat protein [Syntrophales bacterium]|jgi:Flp pilus assembly protein TadD|nr:tetratricopeptide repeat protein [Syntrophales bacterium]
MTTRHWKILIPLVLALVTLVVFWQVRDHEFINLDDEQYVTRNPHVRGGLTAGGLAWAFTTTHASNWHPLTWLSHMLDSQLFGMNAAGHLLVNLLFHVANALLVFLVLNRMTQALWQSAAVAFLFALHPLHVESVAMVAERKDVLSTFFLLLTLWAYWVYSRSPGIARMIPVVALFALGLLSKPMIVTLPFVLLLLDYWPLGRYLASERPVPHPLPAPGSESPGKKKKQKKKQTAEGPPAPPVRKKSHAAVPWALVTEKIPLFVLTILSSIVTFHAQQKGGAMSPLDDIPLMKRMGNALIAYASYLIKTFFPQGLAVFYPYPASLPAWQVLGSAALICAITIVAVHFRKRFPYVLVGWLWYLGTLVPVIGIVQVGMQSMADRYTYMPHIGLFIAVVWGIGELAGRHASGRKILAAVTGIVFAGLTVATWNQLSYWRNSITLFEHALRVTEQNSLAHLNLGVALNRAGKGSEAAEHYREALRINPNTSGGHFNLANYYSSTGRKDEALLHYREAVRINPRYASAYNNLGLLMMSERRAEEAIPYYRSAVELEPSNAGIRYNYGIALAAAGRLPEAIVQFNSALESRPDYPEAHNYLGMALLMQGNREEGIRHFRQALWLKPDFAPARRNLDNALGNRNAQAPAGPPRSR